MEANHTFEICIYRDSLERKLDNDSRIDDNARID